MRFRGGDRIVWWHRNVLFCTTAHTPNLYVLRDGPPPLQIRIAARKRRKSDAGRVSGPNVRVDVL